MTLYFYNKPIDDTFECSIGIFLIQVQLIDSCHIIKIIEEVPYNMEKKGTWL